MKCFVLLSFILLLGPENEVRAQRLEFYMEDLNFCLDTNTFKVDGYYYLSNSDTAKTDQLIFYPFPQETGLGRVDSIMVYDEMERKELPVTSAKNNSGVSFPLSIEGLGFRKIRIVYRQSLKDHFATYILKTTQNWGKPLATANYTLTVPDYIKIDSLSYPADSVKVNHNIKVYCWNKKDFFPREDFNIYFNH
jgi:hypothetical protein